MNMIRCSENLEMVVLNPFKVVYNPFKVGLLEPGDPGIGY